MSAAIPWVMSNARARMILPCWEIYHPDKTCRAYLLDKLYRSTLNSARIAVFASLIPQINRNKKDLLSGNPRKMKKAIKNILEQFIRATLFLILSCGGPFFLVCSIPPLSDPFTFLTPTWRITWVYIWTSIATLIVELPTKMPAYMGFFFSKAFSLFWARLKLSGAVPSKIAFEKELTFALLAGLIGLISVKRGKITATKEQI